uniref:Tail protein n=1 Tax=Siphoviridae sp. ctA4S13 TaxID=2826179 RepID=A0A8S5MR01_9CAUD|nr:MAG TPA: tail protein [Siphoviridae sp. ctA4S13]
MINIYNLDGEIIMQAPITKEAQREEELSKSDFISLSFSAACKIILPVGAYIVHTYYIDQTRKVTQRFSLLEPYEPVQTDEMSWKYTPKFQHPKMLLGKIPFYIKTKNSQNETIKQTNWTFVGTPDVIMGKICDFLNNDIQFGKCGWKSVLSGELKNSLSVSFSDNDVLSALSSIANAEGDTCEWHIDYDNEDIYLGKVVLDEVAVPLEVGRNIGTPSVTESKENYYNAYTVFGGTRNITQTNSLGENVSSSDIRLQLASGKGIVSINGKEVEYTVDDFSTIDLRKDKTKEPLLTKVLNFSDVFPSLNTYVYKVRGRQKYVLDDTTKKKIPLTYNADGSVATYKTFTVWYMRLAYCTNTEDKTKKLVNKTVDDGVTHYWYDFEITDNLIVNGKTLSCSFEANTNINALSTPLAGRGTNGEHVGFELKYHKDNYSAHDSDDVDSANFNILSGDYEIIYQEENNLIIPTNKNERLIPRGESLPNLSCNITVLYNIAMSEQYQKDAQEKLLNKAIKEIERLNSDLNNYEFSVYPQVFEANNPRLQIGQKVKYSDGQGYTLDTRILKLTTNLDYDFIQEITVGNQANKGTITQLKDDVQTIIANSSNGNGSSYSGSEFNSIVSKYGSKYFLSKQYDDIAQGQIRFMKGLKIGDGEKGVDAKGNAKLADAVLGDVIVDRVHDVNSTPADRVVVGAQGFDLYLGEDGKSHLYIDFLVARVKAFFAQLEIRRVSYSGGTTIFSNAGSTIAKVMELKNGNETVAYKCYAVADDGTTKTMNWWHVGMMALCHTFNVKSGTSNDVSNRYYWRLVVDTGQEVLADGKTYDYVVLSNVKDFSGNGTVHGDIRPLSDLFEDYENTTTDDSNTAVASRMFYGYEAVDGGEPDAPAEGDVIVQVGDQIRWKSYGNVIKLATSTEDNATDKATNAPSITMYHGIGAPRKVGTAVTPYVWQEVTCILSPEKVRINADTFELFSGSPDNVISLYVVSYELVPTSRTLVKHDDGTTTPNYFGGELYKHVGSSKTAVGLTEYDVKAEVTYMDGNEETLNGFANLYGSVLGNLKSLRFVAYAAGSTDVLASCDIAVLQDGADGKPGSDGEPGSDGADGVSAIEVVWKPNPLVLTTKRDSNGNVSVVLDENRVAWVTFSRDGKDWGKDNIIDFYSEQQVGCVASVDRNDNGFYVVIEHVYQTSVTTSDGKTITVPVTTASVSVAAKYRAADGSYSYIYSTLTVNIDVSAVWGGLKMDMSGLTSSFSEISKKYNNLPLKTQGELTDYTSTIKQTARDISLKVSETAVGRKNLLVDSAFEKRNVFVTDSYNSGIQVLDNVGGVNSYCLEAVNPGEYPWFSWCGDAGGNIKVEKGKTYTLSVWAKRDSSYAYCYCEFYLHSTKTTKHDDSNRVSLSAYGFSFRANKVWELKTYTFAIPENATMEYLEVMLILTPLTSKTSADNIHCWYCQPMLVEGDEYVGWSMSKEDAEYVGGNLLDNTDTLKTGGTLTVATENTGLHPTDGSADEIARQTYNGCATLNSDARYYTKNIDTVQWDLGDTGFIKQGQDYMLSFWAKGNKGGRFAAYLYKDGSQRIYTEVLDHVDGHNQLTSGDGYAMVEFDKDYEWKQYWVHWRVVGSNLPKYVLIRCMQGCDLYVSQPKLEYGATVTDYTTSRSMSSRLLDAGIDINSKQITLTADKTVFRDQSGKETAVFKDGAINANLIKAKQAVIDTLRTESVEAGNLHVKGSSTFGIWKIEHDSTYNCDIITANVESWGGANVSGSMIQYTPAFVRGGNTLSGFMRVGAYVTEFGCGASNGEYTGVWLGKSAYTVAYGAQNTWGLPTNYKITAPMVDITKLVAYIYSPYSGDTPSVYMYKPDGGVVMETNAGIRAAFISHVDSPGSDFGAGDSTGLIVTTNNSYSITVTLPKNPIAGQQVTVVQKGRGKVYIKSTTANIRTAGESSATQQRISNSQGQISLFVFDGTDWNCSYFNSRMYSS